MASASATHNPEKRGVGYGLASTGLSSPRDSDLLLVKNASGGGAAQILWKESGTGVKWAVVRLGRWSPTVFPVNLTQTGGSQGTTTTPATWTYSVIDPVTSQTLATAVNPTVSPHKWKRPSAGWMIAATFGYAHFNAQGQLVLGWINEMVEQEACSS